MDKANRPDLTPLIKTRETVVRALKPGDIVVYGSTVYPGATEEVCVPSLERVSGLRFNQHLPCGYILIDCDDFERMPNLLRPAQRVDQGGRLRTAPDHHRCARVPPGSERSSQRVPRTG